MSLPAVSKHLKVLEHAGLVSRGRERQWRPARLRAVPLKEVAEWTDRYRRFWDERYDRLLDAPRTRRTGPSEEGKERWAGGWKLQAHDGDAGQEDRDDPSVRRAAGARFERIARASTCRNWWGPRKYEVVTCETDFGWHLADRVPGSRGRVCTHPGVLRRVPRESFGQAVRVDVRVRGHAGGTRARDLRVRGARRQDHDAHDPARRSSTRFEQRDAPPRDRDGGGCRRRHGTASTSTCGSFAKR